MKYVKQIGVILGITMLGEVLYVVLPLPVPAGVYGLFLMLGALISGLVKLESVEGTGNFLLDTMSMMFIPATVGIVESFGEVKKVLVPFLVIIAVSTILVMIVTGHIAQWVIGRSGQEEAANALGVQTFKASEEKEGI
ncbi:MAG: CidA/LrgA family protein [Clostridiaceae bacterium]|nr:CidA/LrgA family protein [Clostridiaceae bacterium]